MTDAILVGDARSVLRRFVYSRTVHLVVTSPPYNVGIDYPDYADTLDWDKYWDTMSVVCQECLRVLVDGGRIAINWPGYAVGKRPGYAHHHRFAEIARSLGMPLLTEIVWDQQASGTRCQWGSFRSPSAPRFCTAHEVIQVWGARSLSRADRTGHGDATSAEFCEWTGSTWRFSGDNTQAYPATFPVDVPFRLIKLLTWPGEMVLDPFCGSGTTCVAAKMLGRQWLGIDISQTAVSLAERRVRECDSLFTSMEVPNE